MTLLSVKNLSLQINKKPILENLSFDLKKGEITGLVGESGSGKSLTALSIMQLLPNGAKLDGDITFSDTNIANAGEERLCNLRGDDIAMVFQEPMTALNPLKTIGDQVSEGIQLHRGVSKSSSIKQAGLILTRVGLPPDQFPLTRYPHELSGGQRQRVVIAIACALKPKLLIADEPTTALDVIVQAKILDLLKDLVKENQMALLLISHDLGVVAKHAKNIIIMRNGRILEQGPTLKTLKQQSHPYTRQLAEASQHIPRQNHPFKVDNSRLNLLEVNSLVLEYKGPRKSLLKKPIPFRAVNNVSFDIQPGEILGLVGKSGCGKTTLSHCLLGLKAPVSGSVSFLQTPIDFHAKNAILKTGQYAQAIFQDPYGSFNPRHQCQRLICEPLHRTALTSEQKRDKAVKALEQVGLSSDDLEKYAHEFSGGQRQRLAIARAIINDPQLIIADEPVSALDVSIRAQILDLIIELRENMGIAWLFVSHDLSVVHAICDRVMIMRNGQIIERGITSEIYKNPSQAYTSDLINAAPDLSAYL